jgi:hypothetical protein
LGLCEPDWIRTNDLLLRRQLLYPAELPVLVRVAQNKEKMAIISKEFMALNRSLISYALFSKSLYFASNAYL